MKKFETEQEIVEIEKEMLQPDFWQNKVLAQSRIAKLQDLKNELIGVGKYDKNDVTITIFAGAGGDDAEDWVRMLLDMYIKFAEAKNWQIDFLDQNKNDQGGFRSVTFEMGGKNIYGTLKNEAGVHRLVRKSPFNSAGKRQTSFAMVEVVPQLKENKNHLDFEINPDDLRIEFTKSSGPGGQNVNKRETAVRITHIPTKISAFVSTERSQASNKEKALQMIRGKIFNLKERQKRGEIRDLTISKDTQAEWGSQIRSYVLHPYKLAKDHRTAVETSDVDGVLSGKIDLFIEAMKE